MQQFGPEQTRAINAVGKWLKASGQQVFRLFGYAGTGKTTLAKHLSEGVGGKVLFAAFTGKAAHVLQTKGCPAQTIHSLIYLPKAKSKERLQQLEERLKNTDTKHEKYPFLKKLIEEEQENLRRPMWQLNLDSPLKDIELLVIDEVSMVDEQMAKDLMSFGCKILVLGDPGQLPPVFGTGYFINAKPDFMLAEVHRQAADSPIIRLATEIRNQQIPKLGSYGSSWVMSKDQVTPEFMLAADQILVGKNKTRFKFNKRIRQLKNFTTETPEKNDRLVCLKNNNDMGLLNGAIWTVDECVLDEEDELALLTIQPEDGGVELEVGVVTEYFKGEKPPIWRMDDGEHFDYGYALTCHKAQGSEWPSVVVYDEKMMRGGDYFKWLYTAVTRASDRVALVK